MYNKIISIPVFVIGICLLVLFTEPKMGSTALSGFQLAGIIIGGIGFLWMLCSLMDTLMKSTEQLRTFKETIRLQKKLAIKIDFKNSIEKEFKEILTQTFPNFEKDLVSMFSFENKESKEAFLAVCPELESGSSFEKYVDELSDAMEEIQEVRIELDEKLAEIAFYNEDPWLWFRRPMPANIKILIDVFEK
ncbi:TPA: hypothetical protein DIC40_00005 [Patescibacteria group bacterium]|nr:hypothetical protein P148_SR1C00001G0896 [candidate division SR1 bacterium RAAC1_SR1_1]HCY20260.1 hypothetical protein [Candidatus Gracilibacteria bacterium]